MVQRASRSRNSSIKAGCPQRSWLSALLQSAPEGCSLLQCPPPSPALPHSYQILDFPHTFECVQALFILFIQHGMNSVSTSVP